MMPDMPRASWLPPPSTEEAGRIFRLLLLFGVLFLLFLIDKWLPAPAPQLAKTLPALTAAPEDWFTEPEAQDTLSTKLKTLADENGITLREREAAIGKNGWPAITLHGETQKGEASLLPFLLAIEKARPLLQIDQAEVSPDPGTAELQITLRLQSPASNAAPSLAASKNRGPALQEQQEWQERLRPRDEALNPIAAMGSAATEKPLFTPNRRASAPNAATEKTKGTAEPLLLGRYRPKGFLSAGASKILMLEDTETGETLRLKPQDRLQDWVIVDADAKRLQLRHTVTPADVLTFPLAP